MSRTAFSILKVITARRCAVLALAALGALVAVLSDTGSRPSDAQATPVAEEIWAWGGNGEGQLGDNTTTQRRTPVQVQNLSGVVDVAGGNQGIMKH